MSRESPGEEALTPQELNEVLADATRTTAEAIEEEAAALHIAPPHEGEVMESDD